MMSKIEFHETLGRLGLTQTEAAILLSVSTRTVRRWAEDPTEIPGPAEQALRAWLRLERLGLAWRPDGIGIGEDDPNELADQIARFRRHAIDLDALIRKVKARGGPAVPWRVDLKRRQATLGPVRMSFYPLMNGGFSPGSYSRSDVDPDIKRDWKLIEDAFACIASAVADAGPQWAN